MNVSEMKHGRMYTIQYRDGDKITPFDSCRFDGFDWLEPPGDEDDEIEKIEVVKAYRADTSPALTVFRVDQIVDVTAED